MQQDLNFLNTHYGVCNLRELKYSEDIQKILKKYSKEQEEKIFRSSICLQKDSQLQKFNIYEILNQENIFLGVLGFFEAIINTTSFIEVFLYVEHQYRRYEIGSQAINSLIDFIFQTTKHEKVLITSLPDLGFSKLLKRYGFTSENDFQFKLTRYVRGVYNLSKIIKQESKSLYPQNYNLVDDLTVRASRLWYSYFSKGICLSNGGVEKSFIELDDSMENFSLKTFNMYETKFNYSLTQEQMKNFLVEEGAISKKTNLKSLVVSFCLGSHEGFTRTARCIYRRNFNEGIFFPLGGYGLLAVSIADLKPLNYKVNIVKVDEKIGEKILLDDLKHLVVKYPKNKTLFVDMKTTCGAVYTPKEIEDIVLFCKKNKIFLIADAAHFNMEFYKKNKIPDISQICQELSFHEFIVMYTGSKTYGLERARTGFLLFSEKNFFITLKRMNDDFMRVFGTISDLPLYVAYKLVMSSLSARQEFLLKSIEKHRLNMNLMIAYIEGIHSKKIDSDLKEIVRKEIPLAYHKGIIGMRIIYKPESGIQMKVDVSGLKEKYVTNIRMFNAEIFSYALNIIAGVVSLHSYQILDPRGHSMRLSFSIKEDVHEGMRAIHNFVDYLTDFPTENPFLPNIKLAEELIIPASKNRFTFLNFKAHKNSALLSNDRRLAARL